MSRQKLSDLVLGLGRFISTQQSLAAVQAPFSITCLQNLTVSRSLSSFAQCGSIHLPGSSDEASCSGQQRASLPTSLNQLPFVGIVQPCRSFASSAASSSAGNHFVGLENLRDNPKATKLPIRVGRGDRGKRGNYAGRGMKGQKAHGRKPHLLYDGGQLSLLKYPVVRQRPAYEALYTQLGLSRVVEYVQLGLLDPRRVITMKDLLDTGCIQGRVKYGVMLYGSLRHLAFPLHIQVTSCEEDTRRAVVAAGGSVTRVYYTDQGLQALLKPELYTSKHLPLPPPAHSWHPRFDAKFDAIGQLPPATDPAAPLPAPPARAPALLGAVKPATSGSAKQAAVA